MSATTDAMSQGAVLLYNNMSPAQPIKLAAAPIMKGARMPLERAPRREHTAAITDMGSVIRPAAPGE